MDGLHDTNLVVKDDPARREYVLFLDEAEVGRVSYADVFAALKAHPLRSPRDVLLELAGARPLSSFL